MGWWFRIRQLPRPLLYQGGEIVILIYSGEPDDDEICLE